MKKVRLALMASAVVLAIGGAAVSTRASSVGQVAYQNVGEECQQISTACSPTGNTACSGIFQNDDCSLELKRN